MKINRDDLLLLYTLNWINECIKSNLLPKGCVFFEGEYVMMKFNNRKVKRQLKGFNPSNAEVIKTFMGMIKEGLIDEEICNDFLKNNYPSFLEVN